MEREAREWGKLVTMDYDSYDFSVVTQYKVLVGKENNTVLSVLLVVCEGMLKRSDRDGQLSMWEGDSDVERLDIAGLRKSMRVLNRTKRNNTNAT